MSVDPANPCETQRQAGRLGGAGNNLTILWTELVAFDPEAPDRGVGRYCEGLGFTPEAISLFLWGCDFVHLHDGMAADRDFPPDIGTYLDIYFEGPKVPGMVWSKFKLRSLVEELHKQGIKVLFSIFPSTLRSRFHREWVDSHPEVQNLLVGELRRDPAAINPLKRLADGSYYEDFLLEKVMAVISDYGFDGWHLCDGYNRPWYQLWQADFSDDMIGQSGLKLPVGMTDAEARAEYIWTNLRREWIDFYVRRNTAYLKKIVETLHRADKIVTCHTDCARDPVDTIYRYGVDYRRLDELGFDAVVIECVGCAGATGDHIFRAHYGVPFDNVVMATALLTRVCFKKTPMLYMNGVQDMTEGYSCLRHLPGFLEREMFNYSHLGIWEEGVWRRCFVGREVCLADSETPDEWRRLAKSWAYTLSDEPVGCDGAVLVWSGKFIEAELEAFMKKRIALTAPILYRLMARGVNISSVVDIDDLDAVTDNPVLALHPGLWPEAAREKLRKHDATRVLTGGILAPPGDDGPAEAWTAESEPLTFFEEHPDHDLPEAEYERISSGMPEDFFKVCRADRNSDAPYYRFRAYRLGGNRWRVLVGNVHWQYIYGELVTDRVIKSIVPVNEFRGRPFWIESRPDGQPGSLIYLRVPHFGMAVVDVEFADQQEA